MPDGGEAGGQRALDHVAGAARILADHHAVAVVAVDEVAAPRPCRPSSRAPASACRPRARECRRCRNSVFAMLESLFDAQYTRSPAVVTKRQCPPLINGQFWQVSDSTKRPAGHLPPGFPLESFRRSLRRGRDFGPGKAGRSGKVGVGLLRPAHRDRSLWCLAPAQAAIHPSRHPTDGGPSIARTLPAMSRRHPASER